MTHIKLKICLAFGVFLGGGVITGILVESGICDINVGGAIMALSFGYASLSVILLRCPNCNKRLIEVFPHGGILLLWLVNEKCRNCGHPIE